MKSKGQIDANGVLAAFIGIIVALAILGAIYGDIGKATNVQTHSSNVTGSETFTDAQWENLAGKVVTNVFVFNKSDVKLVSAGTCPGTRGECNYTTRDNQVSDGLLTAQINLTHCAAVGCAGGDHQVNITYLYQDRGYISDSGGRGIAGMIAIFAALAILVIALVPAIKGLSAWR